MSALAHAETAAAPGSHDFDFLHGHWRVHNSRLRQRLRGCTEWESFDATQYCQPLLGGLGNTDELRHGAGPVGMSLRFFDLRASQWQIFWVDPRDGLLQPPVRGAFADGTGVFEGLDTHEGQPVRVRFTWSGTRSETPRWEQAFSADGGESWETNWVMRFTRTGLAPPVYEPLPAADHGFDFFFGCWRVRNHRLRQPAQPENGWENFEGLQICEPLLGGLANYDELRDAQGLPLGLSIHLFDLAAGRWTARWVSARDGLPQPPLVGGFAGGGGMFEGLDTAGGQPVRLRHTWSGLDTPEPRWEQARSADAGRSWTTDWTMDYSRAARA